MRLPSTKATREPSDMDLGDLLMIACFLATLIGGIIF